MQSMDSSEQNSDGLNTDRSTASPRYVYVLLVITLLLATWLRFRHLDGRSAWFDEAFSWTLVTRYSFLEMLQRTAKDVHPPVYYVLLRGWVGALGDSLFAMRALSALFGIGSVGLLFFLCRDVFSDSRSSQRYGASNGDWIGLIASALLAVSAAHIRWSQEIRMYTTGTFLVLITTWLLWRGLTRSHSLRYWLGLATLEAALAATHNYCLFSVVAQGMYLGFLWLARPTTKSLERGLYLEPRKWLGCAAVAAGLYALWVPVLFHQINGVRQDYWIPPVTFRAIGLAIIDLVAARNTDQQPSTISLVIGSCLVGVLFLRCFVLSSTPQLLVPLMGVGPLLMAIDFSFLVASVLVDRYLLFILPFICIAMGWNLWTIRPQRVKCMLIGVVLLSAGYAYIRWWDEMQSDGQGGLSAATEHILETGERDALIVVKVTAWHPVISYYMRHTHCKVVLAAEIDEIPNWYGRPILSDEQRLSVESVRSLGSPRIWVITNSEAKVDDSLYGETERSSFPDLRKDFRSVHPDIQVALLRRRANLATKR